MFDPDGTNAQILSAEYLKQVDATNIYMTGHSKGGNDAIAGYMMSDPDIRDSIVKIDNFEGPGVNEWFRGNYIEGYNELGGKLNSYYPQDTVLGELLIDKDGKTTFVLSEVRPDWEKMGILGEHDLFSFGVGENGSFIETDQSYVSNLINVVLDRTIGNLSMEERINIFNMIGKFGVYSLIARQDDNPYADNEDKAKALLDKIDQWGLLSEAKKEELAKDSNLLSIICEAVDIYENFSTKEKQALHKLLGLLAASGCKKIAGGVVDELYAAMDRVKTQMNDIYDEIIALLSQFRNDVIEKLCEIKDGIFGELENIVDTIADHLKECYDSVADKVEAVLGKGNHMFSININAIKAEIVNMRGSVKNLTVQIQRLSDVKSQLDKEKYGVRMATLATLISNLEKERNSYDQMITTLDKIVDIYSATEKKLCAQ